MQSTSATFPRTEARRAPNRRSADGNHRMMPLPTHLQGLVVPLDGSPNEDPLEANVRCPCGSESFELLYPGATTPHNDCVIPVELEKDGLLCFRIEATCTR